jgi:hypothetical protein
MKPSTVFDPWRKIQSPEAHQGDGRDHSEHCQVGQPGVPGVSLCWKAAPGDVWEFAPTHAFVFRMTGHLIQTSTIKQRGRNPCHADDDRWLEIHGAFERKGNWEGQGHKTTVLAVETALGGP